MGKLTVPSVDKISASEFAEYLGRYPACIEAISTSKGAKDGQKSLLELDEYRYGTAVNLFGSRDKESPLTLDEVKLLVEWKLRHGKFRPTLMKLVSSNPSDVVKETVQKAIGLYRDKGDVSEALGILMQLKGIGPATASLLLAVHDPENVIFFADEAFYWLCGKGSKCLIKYNAKEYVSLTERSQAVSKRLGVRAVDVERVAFVLMRQGEVGEQVAPGKAPEPSEVDPNKEVKKGARQAKREMPEDKADVDVKGPARRSKRARRA